MKCAPWRHPGMRPARSPKPCELPNLSGEQCQHGGVSSSAASLVAPVTPRAAAFRHPALKESRCAKRAPGAHAPFEQYINLAGRRRRQGERAYRRDILSSICIHETMKWPKAMRNGICLCLLTYSLPFQIKLTPNN